MVSGSDSTTLRRTNTPEPCIAIIEVKEEKIKAIDYARATALTTNYTMGSDTDAGYASYVSGTSECSQVQMNYKHPLNIWKKYMNIIHQGLELKEFPDYADEIDEENKDPWKEDEKETTTRPGWQGGGTPNTSDGDTPHGVDTSGMGDKDVDVSGMGDKDYPYIP